MNSEKVYRKTRKVLGQLAADDHLKTSCASLRILLYMMSVMESGEFKQIPLNEFKENLGIEINHLSTHLKELAEKGYIAKERDGKFMKYQLLVF